MGNGELGKFGERGKMYDIFVESLIWAVDAFLDLGLRATIEREWACIYFFYVLFMCACHS
jgi:hypothetical protein